ncbi:MAG TPA: hypothetical protein VFV19_13130 [Candidatus Polarisedimenticolaceae bacterium]|nr:hypothetical protein [Candidatus Polarisedimenticolaceae bacterium]
MTGLQLASFWEGNRAQLFATYVLSSVAAVVPVPVPMDFGYDLLCTLTRRERHALFAGRAFGVQVKSRSDPEIRYGGMNDRGDWKRYELEWLYEQQQSFVVCVVDLKEWRVNLYSTQFMWWVPWQKGMPGEVVLVPDLSLGDFTEAEGRSMQNRYRASPLPNASDGSRPGDGFSYRVPLGNPIVSVSVKEHEAAAFRDQVRRCLERWVGLDYRNLTHWRLKVPYVEEWITWVTNEAPEPPAKLWHFFNDNPDQNIPEILSSISPAIASLMHNLNHQKQYGKLDVVRPLAALIHTYGLLDPTAIAFVADEKR